MAKKRKHTPRQASMGTTISKPSGGGVVTGPNYPTEEIKWWREAIEGLLVAIVLALLIRGFEAEAFVIPTGSMAPTLRGRHKDVACEQCEYQYAAGASLESETTHGDVVMTICPMCAYPQEVPYNKARDASFAGDRILVNKFSYDPLGEPERFDVIVFKNPNDAKQNYIKRLCGLPGETVRIFRGDIYTQKNSSTSGKFKIARKPPSKILAMLQPVHDTKYVSSSLTEKGLPPRWQPTSGSQAWVSSDGNRTFEIGETPTLNWLRYRHIVPDLVEWAAIKANEQPVFQGARGQLISDSYAYNSYLNRKASFDVGMNGSRDSTFGFEDRRTGKNWVGDLAVECNIQVKSEAGELVVDLVEGGWHFQCTLDVESGKAKLSILNPDGKLHPFTESQSVEAQTKVGGRGSYRIMFSNVDSELRLWVNGSLVDFGQTTTYGRGTEREQHLRPYYSGAEDPGDLAPVGIAGRNLVAQVERLRVHRDKYYVAVKGQGFGPGHDPTAGDFMGGAHADAVRHIFRSPEEWATTELFNYNRLRQPEFVLEDFEDDSKDQFFPMGDNSPQSHDARVWNSTANFVERQFLIGEAVLIYFPHAWHAKLPGKKFRTIPLLFYPKFSRMGIIR